MSLNCCMFVCWCIVIMSVLFALVCIDWISAGNENRDVFACWMLQVAVADSSGVVQVFGIKKRDVQVSGVFSIFISALCLTESSETWNSAVTDQPRVATLWTRSVCLQIYTRTATSTRAQAHTMSPAREGSRDVMIMWPFDFPYAISCWWSNSFPLELSLSLQPFLRYIRPQHTPMNKHTHSATNTMDHSTSWQR